MERIAFCSIGRTPPWCVEGLCAAFSRLRSHWTDGLGFARWGGGDPLGSEQIWILWAFNRSLPSAGLGESTESCCGQWRTLQEPEEQATTWVLLGIVRCWSCNSRLPHFDSLGPGFSKHFHGAYTAKPPSHPSSEAWRSCSPLLSEQRAATEGYGWEQSTVARAHVDSVDVDGMSFTQFGVSPCLTQGLAFTCIYCMTCMCFWMMFGWLFGRSFSLRLLGISFSTTLR